MADGGTEHGFVKIVEGWGETQFGPNAYWIDVHSKFAMEKIARSVGKAFVPPELQSKIAELQGRLPGDKVAFYNRALGCAESYGINKNGDQWRRHELIAHHGTFVSDAHYFDHHKNQDPRLGWGKVAASAWNPRTDMVDLIIVSDLNKQAEQDIQLLERGLSVPTSMGCRVQYDVCLVCGNKARHRGEYCEHVKEGAVHPYGMCAILPDGRVCGVDNPNPRFFDISRVTNPAFLGSENLLKVAESITGAYSRSVTRAKASTGKAANRVRTEAKVSPVSSAKLAEDFGLMPKTEKSQSDSKAAAIIKRLPGRIDAAVCPDEKTMSAVGKASPAVAACMPKISASAIEAVVKAAGIDGLIRESSALGIVLSPDEWREAMSWACNRKIASFPAPTVDEILNAKPVDQNVFRSPSDPKIAGHLASYFSVRSVLEPVFTNLVASTQVNGTQKHANQVEGTSSEVARRLYASYRSGLINNLVSAGGDQGEVVAMKLAETSRKMVSGAGVSFALLAFCPNDMRKDAQEFSRSPAQDLAIDLDDPDNGSSSPQRISGQMADEFGEEVLGVIAANSLRRFFRSPR